MSRGDAFDAFYRDSRERLLHQVYAYSGDPDVAKRALADAYVSAAQHWNKVSAEHNPESWVRSRAFGASSSRRNRSREPWYQSARRVADNHRGLLTALGALSAQDRRLLITHDLAGLDVDTAAREVGLSKAAAADAVARATRTLEDAGVAPSGVPAALAALRTDLPRERINQAGRLRARGDRRRREGRLLLAGVVILVLAIVAGSVNAARRPAASGQPPAARATTSAPSTAPVRSTPQVRHTDLARVRQVALLDPSSAWSQRSTSSDFGDSKAADQCLDASPTPATARHYWVRTFSSRTIGVEVTQTLEVAPTTSKAVSAYGSQLTQFGTCTPGSHRVVSVQRVRGAGNQAAVVTLEYADPDGIHSKQVAIAQSGTAVSTMVVLKADQQPLRSSRLVRLLAASVDKVCGDSGGDCATPPYQSSSEVPPPDPVAPGNLATVDLPLFTGVSEPWVATRPASTSDNPAATECDRADFSGAGATDVTARNYVIPAATQLPDLFGITETIGTFGSIGDAKAFVASVATSVAGCANRQLTLSVSDTAEVTSPFGGGFVWRIALQTSQSTTLVFRVALVRAGSRVAEVTFTPSGSYDVTPDEFVTIAQRATARLSQR
jgi:DNA-directed RNA polymerase specialized sigma24 family protein